MAKRKSKHKKSRHPSHGKFQINPTSGGGRLSICMIVKNEEEALPKCLSSIQGLADELIVVDTGSTDRTVKIVQGFGAKVYYFAWNDNFSDARNESLKHATGDWILWLDADDILPKTHHATIRRLLGQPNNHAFFFRLENVGGDEATCYQLRMFPNLPGIEYTMPVHEQVLPSLMRLGVNKMVNLDVSVIHTGYTDAKTIAAKNAKYLGIMEKWLVERPQDYVTRAHVARIYHTNGRHREAIREYRIVVNDPRCRQENEIIYISSLIFTGRSHLDLKQYPDALAAFEDALRIQPDYDVVYMCFGEAYTRMGDADKAIEFLEKLREKGGIQPSLLPIDVNSLNYHSRHFLAKNYVAKNRAAEAIDEYRAAIQINPRQTEASAGLAELLANRGNLAEAHAVLDGAIQAQPEAVENYVNQAILYIDENRYDEAEQALQAVFARDSTHSRAHFQHGCLHRLQGNLQAAERSYRKAIENNPANLEAQNNLGHLYSEMQQFDKAENAFDAVIHAYRQGASKPSLDTWLGYAYSCAADNHSSEKLNEVYREMSQQFAEIPDATREFSAVDSSRTDVSARIWVKLGQALLDRNLPQMATYASKTAIAIAPQSDLALEAFGDVLMSTDKYEDAREQYEKALEIAPDRLELFFRLGDCYLNLGASEVAQMCYQQGLKSNPLLKTDANSV
ncbi:MAG: tetratricopeptide repeat protein [Candidatus Poribacteria bacterium]